MKVIPGTKFRAIENYESKKEKWLLQVASDPEAFARGAGVRAISQTSPHGPHDSVPGRD